jgi:ABC-type oligopeptide transport system substrate-binding subunit
VGYYVEAERNPNFTNKITNQKFDVEYLKNEIVRLSYYQSDALHWNLEQIDKIWEIANRALDFYNKISKNLGVEMHSIVI